MFGRGNRTDLDENDLETQKLVKRMRVEVAREFERGDYGLSRTGGDEVREAVREQETGGGEAQEPIDQAAAAIASRDKEKSHLSDPDANTTSGKGRL